MGLTEKICVLDKLCSSVTYIVLLAVSTMLMNNDIYSVVFKQKDTENKVTY